MLAAVLGMSAVLLGAFGAHALKQMVAVEYLQVWRTASYYQLVHSILIVALSLSSLISRKKLRFACWCLFLGAVLFSGSLYLYVLTGSKFIIALTPLGGVLLALGWAYLFLAARELPAE